MFKEGKGFPIAPSNDEDELWDEAANLLYDFHNDYISDDNPIKERILNGFKKDMKLLKSKFHITRNK